MDYRDFKNYAVKHKGLNSLYVDQHMENGVRYMPQDVFTTQIIEERQMNAVAMDVFSRLMMDRIMIIGSPINDVAASVVQAQLLYLESTEPHRDIMMYINSPGGAVYAGLGIYDTMQYISSDVATICTGVAASMAAILLCAGTKGKRTALKHSRIMIHQPLGGFGGQASDIEITANEILKIKKELYDVLSLHTGKTFEEIEQDSDRDFWMKSQEAKEYGMVDEVLISKPKQEEED